MITFSDRVTQVEQSLPGAQHTAVGRALGGQQGLAAPEGLGQGEDAAVGRKMTYRPGISGKIFRALGEEKINIRTIAQGADELSIIVGVENKNYEAAVRVLYESFAG